MPTWKGYSLERAGPCPVAGDERVNGSGTRPWMSLVKPPLRLARSRGGALAEPLRNRRGAGAERLRRDR